MSHHTETVAVIIISGRSGVGKSSVAFELCEQLRQRRIPHANLETDYLDDIWPEEPEGELLHMNLSAIWSNMYHHRGCRRLVLSGTSTVTETEAIKSTLGQASSTNHQSATEGGCRVVVHPFILTASDSVAGERLAKREVGTTLARHVESSKKWGARYSEFPDWATRIPTGGRSVYDVAMDILQQAAWAAEAA